MRSPRRSFSIQVPRKRRRFNVCCGFTGCGFWIAEGSISSRRRCASSIRRCSIRIPSCCSCAGVPPCSLVSRNVRASCFSVLSPWRTMMRFAGHQSGLRSSYRLSSSDTSRRTPGGDPERADHRYRTPGAAGFRLGVAFTPYERGRQAEAVEWAEQSVRYAEGLVSDEAAAKVYQRAAHRLRDLRP